MTFYIVKGANGSCGRGCDSWIQAEGKIEADTPARFKAILDRVGDRNLPIYFASPGGNLERAMTMGNMLHARSIAAGVGEPRCRNAALKRKTARPASRSRIQDVNFTVNF